MKKIFLALNRLVLVAGVLVALTPCGFCHASTQVSSSKMKACAMGSMGGMKCCHSSKAKSQSPLCKTMNQSSVVSTLHGPNLAAVPVISAFSRKCFFVGGSFCFSRLEQLFRLSSAGTFLLKNLIHSF